MCIIGKYLIQLTTMKNPERLLREYTGKLTFAVRRKLKPMAITAIFQILSVEASLERQISSVMEPVMETVMETVMEPVMETVTEKVEEAISGHLDYMANIRYRCEPATEVVPQAIPETPKKKFSTIRDRFMSGKGYVKDTSQDWVAIHAENFKREQEREALVELAKLAVEHDEISVHVEEPAVEDMAAMAIEHDRQADIQRNLSTTELSQRAVEHDKISEVTVEDGFSFLSMEGVTFGFDDESGDEEEDAPPCKAVDHVTVKARETVKVVIPPITHFHELQQRDRLLKEEAALNVAKKFAQGFENWAIRDGGTFTWYVRPVPLTPKQVKWLKDTWLRQFPYPESLKRSELRNFDNLGGILPYGCHHTLAPDFYWVVKVHDNGSGTMEIMRQDRNRSNKDLSFKTPF
jgi:hypothetical protein